MGKPSMASDAQIRDAITLTPLARALRTIGFDHISWVLDRSNIKVAFKRR